LELKVAAARCAIVALAAACAACAGEPRHPIKENPMSSEITSSASRVGMPALPPITFEGKRYQQIMNGEREGLGQRTGLMSVLDLASGAEPTIVKIYDFPREAGLEADAGDVFFKTFELDTARRELRIENERRQRFVYGIDDGVVRELTP
jgi:hypothetical protein